MSARLRPILVACLAAGLLCGCVAPGGGPVVADYGYGGWTGYYGEPGFADWGWGPGYRVGPFYDERPYRAGRFDHTWRGPAGGRGRIPPLAGHVGRVGGGFHGGFYGGGHGGGDHGR
jgi:hypothetical protein